MEIPIDELIKRLLVQMQQDSALSDEEKERLRRELEKLITEEGISDEKK